jgi:hypothetical protein
MNIIEQSTATISFDMEGDARFMVGRTAYYLNEFLRVSSRNFDAYLSISNVGLMGIKVNEAEETVDYTIYILE